MNIQNKLRQKCFVIQGRWANGQWTEGQIGRWANGQMGKWADGQMSRWANGQMNKWADGQFWVITIKIYSLSIVWTLIDTHPPVCPFAHLSVCPFAHLSVCPSTHFPIHLTFSLCMLSKGNRIMILLPFKGRPIFLYWMKKELLIIYIHHCLSNRSNEFLVT